MHNRGMLPFGKLRGIRGTRSQVTSAWLAGFERAGCEVTRSGDGRLSVVIPGWDAALFPAAQTEMAVSLQRWFWDRMVVSVADDGSARFRLEYFSPSQLLLHVLVTLFFVAEAWFGSRLPSGPTRFFAAFAVAQAVPMLIALASFRFSRESALRRALGDGDSAARELPRL